MAGYSHEVIEKKWRKYWLESKLNEPDITDDTKKCYVLTMFPYPSASKLHIGHWYNYAPADTFARFMKMDGKNVFFPVGYDAFGLPAENYAIKTGIHPAKSTAENIDFIREQLKTIGTLFDFSREIDTSKPDYYKWTQWIFVQLFKRGLAYRKKSPVNWCPDCMTVLANEQVIDGECERCSSEVEKKDLTQWFLKITDYAEKLLDGLTDIDWPDKTKKMQENWIGKSLGATIEFDVEDSSKKIEAFTTRIDTLYGVTYIVLAPEHPYSKELATKEYSEAVDKYINSAIKATEMDRLNAEKDKTGVFTGAYVINPINGKKVPVWIADYVLGHYGTGAVMAVPAHDQRDYEFAAKYSLEVIEVIKPASGESDISKSAFTEDGVLANSAEFSGKTSQVAREEITQKLKSMGKGDFKVTYRFRDWLVSRQRFWGAPIPIIYCEKCGAQPEKEENLPVVLPYEDVDFRPRKDGKSPLATHPNFINATCPTCGGEGKRELDTMDTFMCSSWYFLRYPDPHIADKPWNRQLVDKWLPVDHYIGGAEHAVMHLLYARFITKALYDMGHIGIQEPCKTLYHQGIITKNGAKMSKSKGNVVNPEKYITEYGSDAFRCYMMFMGSFCDGGDWDDTGISGVRRFLERLYRLCEKNDPSQPLTEDVELLKKLHKTIKKVKNDTLRFHFNTAIASIMEYVNAVYQFLLDKKSFNLGNLLFDAIKLIAPFAPHLAEEMWEMTGHSESIFSQKLPTFDEALTINDECVVVVQINGKVRAKIDIQKGKSKQELEHIAFENSAIKKWLENKSVIKVITIPDKLVNIVIEQ